MDNYRQPPMSFPLRRQVEIQPWPLVLLVVAAQN